MSRSNSKKRSSPGMGGVRKRSRKRKDGSEWTYWEGRISRGFDPKTGKPKTITVTGKSQKEVREKIQTIAVELNDGTFVEPSKKTLGEWLDIWLREYQGSKKPLTVQNYKQAVEKHIRPALGDVQMKSLNNLMIQRCYNGLSEGVRLLSAKSVVNGKIKYTHFRH